MKCARAFDKIFKNCPKSLDVNSYKRIYVKSLKDQFPARLNTRFTDF